MSKLDVLRLFVDQRLSALTDDIFRRFARMIAEYEHEVFRLKQELDRQRRLQEPPGRAGDRAEDRAAGVLQVFPTEGEHLVRGRSFCPDIKHEEGGTLGEEEPNIMFTRCPDWLMERPEREQSSLSNQIQFSEEGVGPQHAVSKQNVLRVKQEVDKGVIQDCTTEEEQQMRGRLHVKQEEGGASGPDDIVTEFTQSPDWLMDSYEDEGSSSSYHIQSQREEAESDHHRNHLDSGTEDSDDAQLGPGLQRTGGSGTDPLVCGSCGREFSSSRTLRKHIRRNTSQDQELMPCSLRRQRAPFQSPAKSFICRICGSSFYTQGILVRHAENHCKEPESRCGACGDCLGSTEVLRDHLRSHKELGSTCDVCGKKCSSIKRMEIHKRVHTGEKPYRCGFCSRDFSRKESLERHLKVHSGDRPPAPHILVVEVDGTKGQLPLSCLETPEELTRRDSESQDILWMKNGEETAQRGNSYVVELEESLGGANYTCYSRDGSLLNHTVVLIKEDETKKGKILVKADQEDYLKCSAQNYKGEFHCSWTWHRHRVGKVAFIKARRFSDDIDTECSVDTSGRSWTCSSGQSNFFCTVDDSGNRILCADKQHCPYAEESEPILITVYVKTEHFLVENYSKQFFLSDIVKPDKVNISKVNTTVIEWTYPSSWSSPFSYFPLTFQIALFKRPCKRCDNPCTDSKATKTLTVDFANICQFQVKRKTKAVCIRAKDAFCNSPWGEWSHFGLEKNKKNKRQRNRKRA